MPLPSATMALSHAWIILIAALYHVYAALVIETALLIGGAAALAAVVAGERVDFDDGGYEAEPRVRPPVVPARARWELLCVR